MRAFFMTSALLAIGLSTPTMAKTNYFLCKVTTAGQEAEYRVTTNEERREVTYEVISNGNVFTKPAIFTPDAVMWGDPPSRSGLQVQFTISRIDLSFSIDVKIGGKVSQPREGKCEILEAPERAF